MLLMNNTKNKCEFRFTKHTLHKKYGATYKKNIY